MEQDILIVGTVSDDPFAIDVAHHFGQTAEPSDLVALKHFANSEFCPRFISDEHDFTHIGTRLSGRSVVIVSTCCGAHTRNALAMRTLLVARAAKDNGAERVVLVEPNLFYSAQDRGPRPEHGETAHRRSLQDLKKFDGQPFSALLYAQILRAGGVDGVVTVHNHSSAVARLYTREFNGHFHDLSPASLFAHYLDNESLDFPGETQNGLVLCAPDAGAAAFVNEVHGHFMEANRLRLLRPSVDILLMQKARSGERQVEIGVAPTSPSPGTVVKDRTVVVLDDMVRTGHTIVECCRVLKEAGAARVVFLVTHFYSSDEVKENLNDPAIDEIVTTNTLPQILNRDMQGRLRKKMLVLKLEKWIAAFLRKHLCDVPIPRQQGLYSIDISSKNPRWRPNQQWPNTTQS
jgi:ribose-phosphate pyrophosphokinase